MSSLIDFKNEMRAFQNAANPNGVPSNSYSISDYLKWCEVKQLERIANTLEEIRDINKEE